MNSGPPDSDTKGKKYLCLGDIHIRNDVLSILERYFEKLEAYLQTCPRYDGIVVMGDTLHHHEIVYTPCLNKAYEYISLLKKYTDKVYVLVGNHDMINHLQFLSKGHCLRGLEDREGIYLIDKIEKVDDVIFCPFIPDGRFIEALQLSLEDKWRDARCIFCHQSFDGAKMGAITLEGVEKWGDDYPQIVSGHIHDRQSPQKNIYYTGSSLQVSYGETREKTAACVSVTDTEVKIQEVNLKPPAKETVYLDILSASEYKHQPEEDVSYKISIRGDPEEIKVFKKGLVYKGLLKTGAKVVFKGEKKISSTEKGDITVNTTNQPFRSFNDILSDLVAEEGLQNIYKVIKDRNPLSITSQVGPPTIKPSITPQIPLQDPQNGWCEKEIVLCDD